MAHRIPPAEVVDHLSAARAGVSGELAASGRARGTGANDGGGGARLLRKLSRRQVRKRLTITQLWQDADGEVWRVTNVHRKDGLVALQGPGARPRFVSFGELAERYRLVVGS